MSLNFKLREKTARYLKESTTIFEVLGKKVTILSDQLFRNKTASTFIKSYIYHAVKLRLVAFTQIREYTSNNVGI